MPKYNLDALGNEEFERMCQAIVQQIIAPGVTVYGMGSDGAREATYEGTAPFPSEKEHWEGKWIIQAKFHDCQQIGVDKARKLILADLENELSVITNKYEYECDVYILMTNVSLTPVFRKGIKDKIDNEIIPKYDIDHIKVLGGEEICRYLDNYTGIRQTYGQIFPGDIIAKLLGLIENGNNLDELVKLYCEGCFEHEQFAQLDDAGDVDDKRIELQRVFIDLDVESSNYKDPRTFNLLPKWLKQALKYEERVSALSYLLDDSIPSLVLIGGPGEGKSTLVQYIAQIYRSYLIGRLDEISGDTQELKEIFPRIPFRILLKEYAQWLSSQDVTESLFQYLAFQVTRKSGIDTSSNDIKSILKENPTILILDGLDEVPEKELKTKVVDNIKTFVNQVTNSLKGNLRVIATTRPFGYTDEFEPSRYLHLNLKKLSPEKTLSYVELWTNAREPDPSESERIRNTFNICLEDNVIQVLTKTALQVTILLVIMRARGIPPKQREELFQSYMDTIYQREQKKSPELLRTEKDTIYGLHKYIAYLLHKRAEIGETAALMDHLEFENRVKEYLIHRNDLLTKEEIDIKTDQIITEARERLILIESPQEGKIGFDLTTTREFFAAAHLVDTSDSAELMDLRFRHIAKSPHWRNVALFFSGRVGRTREAEAPSLVNVCIDIDTERVDKFLKRGSKLVMEMIDDRVLRVPHNEIGAIKYVLGTIDDLLVDIGFINILKNTNEEYRERLIRPAIEKNLNEFSPDKLEPFTRVYMEIFGSDHTLGKALERASKSSSKEIKMWVLSKAIKCKIVEKWVVDLLEEILKLMKIEDIARSISQYFYNFRFYIKFPLSEEVRILLALSMMYGAREGIMGRTKSQIIDSFSWIEADDKINENSLLLFLVSQVLKLYFINTNSRFDRHRLDLPIIFTLPVISSPLLIKLANDNCVHIRNFIRIYEEEDNVLIKFFVSLYEFCIDPNDPDKFYNLSKNIRSFKSYYPGVICPISREFNILPKYVDLSEYYKEISSINKYYQSESQFNDDLEELNQILNKNSKIKNHPYKIALWMSSNFDSGIEEHLDSEILNEIDEWLISRNLTRNALDYSSITVKSDPEIVEFSVEELKRLKSRDINLFSSLFWLRWSNATNSTLREVKILYNEILESYQNSHDTNNKNLEQIYQLIVGIGLVDLNQIKKTYNVIQNKPNFLESSRYPDMGIKSHKTLLKGLKDDDIGVKRLSALSLAFIWERKFLDEEKIEEDWVADVYWGFAKNKNDIWQSKFLRGMSNCNLRWSDRYLEYRESIMAADSEELQRNWLFVILEAGYVNHRDLIALYNLILEILESKNGYPNIIRKAALMRLNMIISEIEPIGFEEKILKLPLIPRDNVP